MKFWRSSFDVDKSTQDFHTICVWYDLSLSYSSPIKLLPKQVPFAFCYMCVPQKLLLLTENDQDLICCETW